METIKNLSRYRRAKLVLANKKMIDEEAKENQSAGGEAVRLKSEEPVYTRKELAELAGISISTLFKVDKIESEASEKDKEDINSGNESINSVYSKLKHKRKSYKHMIDIKYITSIKNKIEDSDKTWFTVKDLINIGFFTSSYKAELLRRSCKNGPDWIYCREGRSLMCLYGKYALISWIEELIKQKEMQREIGKLSTFEHFRIPLASKKDTFTFHRINSLSRIMGDLSDFRDRAKIRLEKKSKASKYKFNRIKIEDNNPSYDDTTSYDCTVLDIDSQGLTLTIKIPLSLFKSIPSNLLKSLDKKERV